MSEIDGDYIRVNRDALHEFVVDVFAQLGLPHDDASIVADVLLAADSRGVETHGVQRLRYYVGRIKSGVIEPRPRITVANETPATALVDGGNGLGHPASKFAMELCLRKAAEVGGAFVGVRNSNHYGIAGYYAMMALPHQMIGLSFTNAGAQVAPTYGRQRMLGTNPLSIAVPAEKERPFVLDMATSTVAFGKIEVALRKGISLLPGWAIDQEGKPTTFAGVMGAGGAMLPLGGFAETAGYKGYGLAAMVDILCGTLTGAAFGRHLGGGQGSTGHFFAAIRPDVFRPLGEFKAAMDQMLGDLKNSAKADGQARIYVAGEKEFEREDETRRLGVPVYYKVLEEIKEIGAEVGVELRA